MNLSFLRHPVKNSSRPRSFSLPAIIACFAVVCGLAFTGCGGGGSDSGSGKKLAANDFLGDLPNAFYQKNFTDSTIRAAQTAEEDKLDGTKKSDWEKAAKIREKYKAKFAEADKKFEAEVEKIKPKLIGKDIPFEVDEELAYKVNSLKITDVQGSKIYVEFEVEITDVTKLSSYQKSSKDLIVQWNEFDKDGNEMMSGKAAYVKMPEMATGAKKTEATYISCDAKYVNFAKIKFLKK